MIMDAMGIIIPVVIIVAAAGAVGYYFIQKRKQDAEPKPWVPPTPTGDNWVFQYSSPGLAGSPADFDFPAAPGSVNYCVRNPTGFALGKKLSMAITITGTGTIIPTEGDPPAKVRFYMQRRGDNGSGVGEYEFYRFWSNPGSIELKVGQFKLDVDLTPAGGWTSVYGKAAADNPTQFQALLNDLQYVGFTFGGMFFGHGVRLKDGAAHFHLDSYSVA